MKHFTFVLPVFALLCMAHVLLAQSGVQLEVSNNFVRVVTLKESGQFHITTAGISPLPLTYAGEGQWYSYCTFCINTTGNDHWYTNQINRPGSGWGGKQSEYLPPDSVIVIGDTIRAIWPNLRKFRIEQDVYVTQTVTAGMAVMRYKITPLDVTSGNLFKGVFNMQDLQVAMPPTDDSCSDNADDPIILTSTRYDARPMGGTAQGACWIGVERRFLRSPIDSIPAWFIAGRRFPNYGPKDSTILGLGILKGQIPGGIPGDTVIPPSEFIVSDFGVNALTGLKDTTWDFSHLINYRDYHDAVVGYKWDMNLGNTAQGRTVQTAYGLNDFDSHFVISDSAFPMMVFATVSPRHHYRDAGGRLDSLNTVLDVYVLNADHSGQSTNSDTLTLDVSVAGQMVSPQAAQLKQRPLLAGTNSSSLSTGQIGHARWVLTIDTAKARKDTTYDERFGFRLTTANVASYNNFNPRLVTTTIHGIAPDRNPPRTTRIFLKRWQIVWRITDSLIGDRGLDSVVVDKSTNCLVAPPSFTRCDPAAAAMLNVLVKDTLADAFFVFHTSDCAGNIKRDTLSYSPKTGIAHAPEFPSHVTVTNFPNPFSGSTRVSFELPLGGIVGDVHMYSALGADVTSVAGIAPTQWNSREMTINCGMLAPGMYQLVVSTNTGVVRHTMALIR